MKRATLRTDAPLNRTLNRKDRGDNIRECLTCGICNSRCTWYEGQGGPNPRQMVRLAQLGLDDLQLETPEGESFGDRERLRGLLDQLVGGPGLRRGRRHPTQLLPGEAVDFWRVEKVEPGELLRHRRRHALLADAHPHPPYAS